MLELTSLKEPGFDWIPLFLCFVDPTQIRLSESSKQTFYREQVRKTSLQQL